MTEKEALDMIGARRADDRIYPVQPTRPLFSDGIFTPLEDREDAIAERYGYAKGATRSLMFDPSDPSIPPGMIREIEETRRQGRGIADAALYAVPAGRIETTATRVGESVGLGAGRVPSWARPWLRTVVKNVGEKYKTAQGALSPQQLREIPVVDRYLGNKSSSVARDLIAAKRGTVPGDTSFVEMMTPIREAAHRAVDAAQRRVVHDARHAEIRERFGLQEAAIMRGVSGDFWRSVGRAAVFVGKGVGKGVGNTLYYTVGLPGAGLRAGVASLKNLLFPSRPATSLLAKGFKAKTTDVVVGSSVLTAAGAVVNDILRNNRVQTAGGATEGPRPDTVVNETSPGNVLPVDVRVATVQKWIEEERAKPKAQRNFARIEEMLAGDPDLATSFAASDINKERFAKVYFPSTPLPSTEEVGEPRVYGQPFDVYREARDLQPEGSVAQKRMDSDVNRMWEAYNKLSISQRFGGD